MGLYLYGITSADGLPPGADVRGIEDAEVRFLGDSSLQLVVSPFDRDVRELQEADPERTLAAVQRHDAVLTAVSASAPVLPVRFGTILADDAAAAELLADSRDTLSEALEAVADADEWVVRVDASDSPEPYDAEADEGLTPGHAFFARKRSEARARSEIRARAELVAADLDGRLAALARASRRLAPREPTTVLRAAYLVGRSDEDRFLAAAHGRDGASIALQGPLPPYRFVEQPTPS